VDEDVQIGSDDIVVGVGEVLGDDDEDGSAKETAWKQSAATHVGAPYVRRPAAVPSG
jgi:hypothetical protein